MSHIRVTVTRVEENGQSRDLSHVDFPVDEVSTLQPETLFDGKRQNSEYKRLIRLISPGRAALRPQ